jgi:pyruvate/2-oxoglutarate/acetoin dehydrogenase E1 component/TPP-dependent pyruvate/acetoin dehydrogenase alpha subunit
MTATTQTHEDVDQEQILRIFETMSRIRAFDDKARSLITSAQAFFVHYPVRGHEIISAAVAAALEPTDYITATYRGLADVVAKGVPLRELWGEMLGRQTGTSKGRGGPMHFADPAHGMMLCTGIVGGGLPIATGLGLGSQLQDDGRVTVCNFGDGATNIGAFHESLNMASVWSLPVVFVCQNNQYGEHTKFSDTSKNASVVDRAPAYAMKAIKVDGMDPVATYLAAVEAVAYARSGAGPVLLECMTFRTLGHVLSDKNEYMDPAELAEQIANDPVPRFRAWLLENGQTEATLADIEAKVTAEVNDAYELAAADPLADPETFAGDVYATPGPVAEEPGEDAPGAVQLTYRGAITQALDQAMAADDKVFLMGEDVADSAGGGVFHLTEGLSTTHGDRRVRNTPIAEEAIIGAAIGSALTGMKPVAEIMFMDFMWVCYDQLSNHAAKLRYMSGGRTPVSMTMRVSMVGGTPIGAQHSQSLEAVLMHTPGLKVVMPSSPYDAKGLLLSCIADEDPCVFIESTALFMKRGLVPTEAYTIPLGKAAVKRAGTDVTIISYGRLVADALKAADELATAGISAEVIDLRTLAPLDMDTILTSVAKTKRAVVVHEAVRTCGAGAEIATRIHEELHSELAGPVRRLTAPDSSVPAAPGLVAVFYPNAAGIVSTVTSMLG